MSKILMKKLGMAILLLPIGFLSLFLFGEVFAGDLSGISHFIQILPVLVLAFVAWKKPFIGGLVMVMASIVMGMLYALDAKFQVATVLLVELFLFLPPFIAGILLILSSKKITFRFSKNDS